MTFCCQHSLELDVRLKEATREQDEAEAALRSALTDVKEVGERRGASSEQTLGTYAYLILDFVLQLEVPTNERRQVMEATADCFLYLKEGEYGTAGVAAQHGLDAGRCDGVEPAGQPPLRHVLRLARPAARAATSRRLTATARAVRPRAAVDSDKRRHLSTCARAGRDRTKWP